MLALLLRRSRLRLGTTALLLGILAACGGGGGGGGPTTGRNSPPTANAGQDQSATEKAAVQLAGQGSDSDGGTLSYIWSQVSGPAGEFDSATAADSMFAVPLVPVGETADIVLRLTVSDGQGGSATDDMTITAASTDAVVFMADKDTDDVNELYRYDTQADSLIKLNDALIAGGAVIDYVMSPDGSSVAYRADQDTDDIIELYVAAMDGSGVSKINAAMANADGDVSDYEWSPDGTRIVYTADADLEAITEVYLVDRDGNNHSKINGNVAGGVVYLTQPTWSPDGRYIAQLVINTSDGRRLGINNHDTQGTFASVRVSAVPTSGVVNSFAWAPDSSVITYAADQDTDTTSELYSVLPDGSAMTKLNAPLVAGDGVIDFNWAPDASRIAYRAIQETANVVELFSALPDGTGNAKLNATLAVGGRISSFAWAPDSSRVAYAAGQDNGIVVELYAADGDGANAVKLNPPLIANGNVSQFLWAPDSSRVAYSADQETDSVAEIFSTTADGSSNVKLNGPLVANGVAVFTSFTGLEMWSPDASQFVYPAAQDTAGVLELYVADADGISQTQVTLTPAGSLSTFARWSADSSSVIYVSSQDTPGIRELYLAAADGSNNLKISGTMVAGGNIYRPSGATSRTFNWTP